MGVIPTKSEDFVSSSSLNKIFKLNSSLLNNGISPEPISKEVERQGTLVPYDGGCSIVAITRGCGERDREQILSSSNRASSRIPRNESPILSFRPLIEVKK